MFEELEIADGELAQVVEARAPVKRKKTTKRKATTTTRRKKKTATGTKRKTPRRKLKRTPALRKKLVSAARRVARLTGHLPGGKMRRRKGKGITAKPKRNTAKSKLAKHKSASKRIKSTVAKKTVKQTTPKKRRKASAAGTESMAEKMARLRAMKGKKKSTKKASPVGKGKSRRGNPYKHKGPLPKSWAWFHPAFKGKGKKSATTKRKTTRRRKSK